MPAQINSSNDSASVINFPRDTTLKETNRILRYLAPLAVQLDGTASGYKATMRRWFIDNGALEADADQLTALCDKWYTITRTPWHGWTTFYQPGVSGISSGTRGGDNVGMACEPSTDSSAERDDFAGNPLFAVVDCNWIIDPATLEIKITAIDGITDNFRRYSPSHFVGVLQMTGYYGRVEHEDTYEAHYSSLRSVNVPEIAPLAEAVKPDGNVRPWVVHSKYPNHTFDGKLTSYSGVIPTTYSISHNSSHTLAKATGAGYSGYTSADAAFLKIMVEIIFASLTLDGIIQGCCSFSTQCIAAESEAGVKRVILTAEQAASLEVGSSVIIGSYTSSTDRNSLHSITPDGAVITAIEPHGEGKAAVYVDVSEPFDTTAGEAATAGTTYVSTYHWKNGTCDGVLGNNGSYKSNTSGKYPGKIQGIEYMSGFYTVVSDTIMRYYQDGDGTYWCEPYVCTDTAKQATSITADYKSGGVRVKQPFATGWYYVVKNGIKKGVSFPTDIESGSSSTYTRDAIYFYGNKADGIYELLLFCALDGGAASAGLSGGYANNGVGTAAWNLGGWLSPNGNRGEWAG